MFSSDEYSPVISEAQGWWGDLDSLPGRICFSMEIIEMLCFQDALKQEQATLEGPKDHFSASGIHRKAAFGLKMSKMFF